MTKIKSCVAISFFLALATASMGLSMALAASGDLSSPPPTAPVQGITNPNTTSGASMNSPVVQPAKPVQKAPSQSQTVNANSSNSTANSTPSYAASATDSDWKNPGLPPLYNFGALTGLGIIDSYGGIAILGTASLTIIDRGFIADISNSVATEIEAGPMITSGTAAFWYSLHIRWDFQKDDNWTLYALGGLGGAGTPSAMGGHFEIWPRFGAGAMYKLTSSLLLRGEVSHEFTGIGISVPFM